MSSLPTPEPDSVLADRRLHFLLFEIEWSTAYNKSGSFEATDQVSGL